MANGLMGETEGGRVSQSPFPTMVRILYYVRVLRVSIRCVTYAVTQRIDTRRRNLRSYKVR